MGDWRARKQYGVYAPSSKTTTSTNAGRTTSHENTSTPTITNSWPDQSSLETGRTHSDNGDGVSKTHAYMPSRSASGNLRSIGALACGTVTQAPCYLLIRESRSAKKETAAPSACKRMGGGYLENVAIGLRELHRADGPRLPRGGTNITPIGDPPPDRSCQAPSALAFSPAPRR